MTHFGGFGKRAADRGAPYASGAYTVWGAAVAMREDLVEPLTRWAITVAQRTGYGHDDVLVCAYMRRIGEQTAMTSRAIFDLAPVKSLLGHNPPIRHPELTLQDAGPTWDAQPRAAKSDRPMDKDVPIMAQEEI